MLCQNTKTTKAKTTAQQSLNRKRTKQQQLPKAIKTTIKQSNQLDVRHLNFTVTSVQRAFFLKVQCLQIRVRILYFSSKTYVVGTQKNRLNEHQNTCKKIVAILGSLKFHIWIYKIQNIVSTFELRASLKYETFIVS